MKTSRFQKSFQVKTSKNIFFQGKQSLKFYQMSTQRTNSFEAFLKVLFKNALKDV